MKQFNWLQAVTCASIMVLPTYAIAADMSSKLTNQSKQNAETGYYLVQDKIIAENDCVKVDGNAKLNPGDSAQLTIKKDCKWGVVRYKIMNINDNKEMGYLKHSYNDGDFSIDIMSVCKGGECNFFGLTADQIKPK